MLCFVKSNSPLTICSGSAECAGVFNPIDSPPSFCYYFVECVERGNSLRFTSREQFGETVSISTTNGLGDSRISIRFID